MTQSSLPNLQATNVLFIVPIIAMTSPIANKVAIGIWFASKKPILPPTYDPENEIYYKIDWGDGSVDNWDGPYNSGEELEITHIYGNQGSYQIKVKAKNQYDAESDWETLSVSMPKGKTSFRFLSWFFENHPIIHRLIQSLFI